MQQRNLTAEGMKQGIVQADVFVLFCTEGVLDRPYVKLEVDTAIDAGKNILLVHEDGES